MGVAAFFVGLGIPPGIAAQLEKKFENKEVLQYSFEEGLRRLKDHVWDKKTESAWVFIEKDGKSGWIDIAIKSSGTAGEIDSAFLRSLFERFDISQTYFAHTHPFGMYDELLPKETVETLKANRKSRFPLPPSSPDILLAAKYKKLLEEKELDAEKLKLGVVDPSGVWEYVVDTAHPNIEELFQPVNDLVILPGHALEISLLDWRSRFINDGGLNKENLEEFVRWAQDEYGITFTYRPHY